MDWFLYNIGLRRERVKNWKSLIAIHLPLLWFFMKHALIKCWQRYAFSNFTKKRDRLRRCYLIIPSIYNLLSKLIPPPSKFFILIISFSQDNPEAAIQRCSVEKMFWKHAANLQENTPTKLLCNIIEIALPYGCSPVNLLHIFRITFPKNTSERLLLIILPRRMIKPEFNWAANTLCNRYELKLLHQAMFTSF